MANWMFKKRFLPLVSILLLPTGCDLSQQAQDELADALNGRDPKQPPGSTTVTDGSCYTDTFYQPAEQILHSVDILFVADTSGSMAPKRARVADALYAFVGALPADTDYRIGVVLAHGDSDPNSGRLYTSSGSIPKVLDSSSLTQATIQNHLKQIMLAAPDHNFEQGEMGSYALVKALSAPRLQESRDLGFFRPDAALAVVTISDENDICAAYPSPLPTEYNLPAGPYASMPGMTGPEKSIRDRDCSSGISNATVVNAIKSVQGNRPFVVGAVIHTDVNFSAAGRNDNYGWGYGQIVAEQHGVVVDIENGDFSSGLSSLGALTTTKINLLTDFTLTQTNVALNSLQVSVDGVPAQFEYNATQNEVHLFDLGQPRSKVDVRYCQNAIVTTDTSTSTSTSTDTGTSTSTTTTTTTSTSTDTTTDHDPNWQIAGFDGTTATTSAALIWQTTGAATTAVVRVGLAPDDLSLLSIPVNNAANSHVISVTGLNPNTRYYFQVVATDENGLTHTSLVISKVTKE